jgi:hypothetical protein
VYNRKNLLKKVFTYIPLLTLLLVVFMTYANTVDDLDFWWHLKSGQFIFETQGIPQEDFFAYTTDVPEFINIIGKDEVASTELPSGYRSNALRGNWLSQLIFYLVYAVGGFVGIGLLKSIVFVIAYLILYVTMMRRGATPFISFLVLCLIAYIGIEFNYTRPQIFSFLLFPCVLYLLYDFKNGGKCIYFLPALMLLWANLHGGFILGVLTIISITFAELLKYLLKNKFGITSVSSFTSRKLRTLFLLSCMSIFASLINPNSYKTFLFPFVFERSLFATVEEYHRPMLYEYHAYWFMLALVLIFIVFSIKKRRLDLSELCLLIIVTIPSLKSIRYIIFFALGSGVFLAYAISCVHTQFKEWGPIKNILTRPMFQKGLLSFLVAILSISIYIAIAISSNVLKFDMRENRYPSGAVAFIKENTIPGAMFNLYNWGGYLIWHLYPDYRVFIDGRCLNETAFFHYNQILKAAEGSDSQIPLWKKLLNAYGVDFIITHAVSPSGKIINLVDNLYIHDEWKLVYADGKSMVFLRNVPENYTLINRYELPKEKIYDEIIDECKQGIKDSSATKGYYETLGYMYMKKNRLKDALHMFQKYLTIDPHDEKVNYYHDLIKEYMKTHT